MPSDINFKEKDIYLFHKMSITYTKVQEGGSMEDLKIEPVTLRMPSLRSYYHTIAASSASWMCLNSSCIR
jgi:hypothetical protein